MDASVWVARLVSQDVFYGPVKTWMTARIGEDDQFLAPSLLLAEMDGAISRRTTASLGLRAIEQVQNLPGLQLVEKENPPHPSGRLRTGRVLIGRFAWVGKEGWFVLSGRQAYRLSQQ